MSIVMGHVSTFSFNSLYQRKNVHPQEITFIWRQQMICLILLSDVIIYIMECGGCCRKTARQ